MIVFGGGYLFFVCGNYYTSTDPLMEVIIAVTIIVHKMFIIIMKK